MIFEVSFHLKYDFCQMLFCIICQDTFAFKARAGMCLPDFFHSFRLIYSVTPGIVKVYILVNALSLHLHHFWQNAKLPEIYICIDEWFCVHVGLNVEILWPEMLLCA